MSWRSRMMDSAWSMITPAQAAPLLVGADGDTFDVAGTELAVVVPEYARYDRRVSYQGAVIGNQHMDTVDAMYPVVGSEAGSERIPNKGLRCA